MARNTEANSSAAVIERPTEVAVIPLDRIRQGTNVRDDLPGIPELAQSIRQHGVLTAVLVTRREDGDYDLDAGYRRFAAATAAGLSTIPAVVRDPVSALQRIDGPGWVLSRLKADNGTHEPLSLFEDAV